MSLFAQSNRRMPRQRNDAWTPIPIAARALHVAERNTEWTSSNGVLKFVIGFASRISKTENNARVPSARRPLLSSSSDDRHGRLVFSQS
jgi:hypothetical protein